MAGISEERRIEFIEQQMARQPPETQALYLESLQKGGGPVFAEMIAMRQAPQMMNSHRTYEEGLTRKMNGMSDYNRLKMQSIAARAGISTNGKTHVSGLGGYDKPDAWVTCAEDVNTICKAKDLTMDGALHRKADKPLPPVKRVALATDLQNEMMRRSLAADPDTAAKCKADPKKLGELREKVVAEHGTHYPDP
jgi:hypothetical protein